MTSSVTNLDKPRWRENLPFWAVHVVALVGAIYTGVSATALWWLGGMYVLHMFAITGGYHRYFSHRTYKTSRWFQFVLALLGVTAVQQGPLWWAAHHRHHHKYSDMPEDVHSPRQRGFWWSHMFWILSSRYNVTHYDRVKDLAKYKELVWLNKREGLVVVAYAALLFAVGGLTALVWGFFVATVACWHGTFCINSLTHVWGSRRYATSDDSRNNLWLAIITMGEGWHNNHHHYQRATNQGWHWWQIDMTYYILRGLAAVRLIWDLHPVPTKIRDATSALASGTAEEGHDVSATLPPLGPPSPSPSGI